MRPARAWVLAALGAVLLFCGPARADSVLYIGTGTGTSCQFGCAGAPNQIDGSSFDLFVGPPSVPPPTFAPYRIDNTLLVLAVPNDSTSLGITINGSTGTFLGFNNSNNVYSGFSFGLPRECTMTTDFLSECLAMLGAPLNDSLANLQNADSTLLGINANGYGMYTFSLGQSFPGSVIQIDGSNVPLGTFAFGYGVEGNGFANATPFSQAGITTPEPGSLILLGTGLLLMAGILRRRFVNS